MVKTLGVFVGNLPNPNGGVLDVTLLCEWITPLTAGLHGKNTSLIGLVGGIGVGELPNGLNLGVRFDIADGFC
jgi:hypothetical protein